MDKEMYIKFIKPCFDIILSIIILPIFLLLYIILGVIIKVDTKGPILYKAERIGKDRKLFTMYKFRTMKIGAPLLINPDGSTYNAENDDRVTRVGRILRKTSLDEIPQIINVLKGEMSFIGPRPSLAMAVGTFQDDEIDKMNVKPGITGYTQAFYRNTISNREKRLKDAWYSINVSFFLDLKVFIKTIHTVISEENLFTNKRTLDIVKGQEDD